MSLKGVIREFFNERLLCEGFDPEGNPDLKYYAFDWDDNIATMPTQILVLTDNDEEVGMSTEDFADYRSMIGKEPFEYNGKMIVGYSKDPYKNFGIQGDSAFIIDSMLAKPGPSWGDFVEAINGGSIFSIITARGHTPSVLREAIYNMIVTDHNGISKESLIDNLKKYRNITGDDRENYFGMINDYLDLNRYYPVTYGEGDAADPEEGKIKALREFISYVRDISKKIGKEAFLKNDIKNNFVPMIGFSDDDPGNVEKIKAFLNKEYKDKPVKTYLTKGGNKKEV
jgi:hypothetical protein|tara:strand:- start:11 stop:862 length:852 start_codon:yes stop_codon:yes gene_type:complete